MFVINVGLFFDLLLIKACVGCMSSLHYSCCKFSIVTTKMNTSVLKTPAYECSIEVSYCLSNQFTSLDALTFAAPSMAIGSDDFGVLMSCHSKFRVSLTVVLVVFVVILFK